jgi:hypothetical protein
VAVAALVTWVLTAAGGFFLLATWIRHGGARGTAGGSHFPPALIFGHFALAAIGLVIWIIYVIGGQATMAWIAFALLVPVALLGFTMFARWLPAYRRAATPTGAVQAAVTAGPAERHFPVAIVAGHGVLAVVTVILVLLTAL